jgi:hypothetical protein
VSYLVRRPLQVFNRESHLCGLATYNTLKITPS